MKSLEKRLSAMGEPYRELKSPGITYPDPIIKKRPRILPWAAAILLVLSAYNYDTFAYYAQKLLGYEQVTSESLQGLIDKGLGQPIDRKVSFSSGEAIWIDRVMTDENNTLIFARITGLNQIYLPSMDISTNIPFFDPSGSSQGTLDEETGTLYWLIELEPPRFLEKHYALSFTLDSGETQTLEFKLNRLASSGKSYHKKIGESYSLEGTTIKLDTVVFSPTSTRVIGSMSPRLKGDLRDLDFTLYYDGKSVNRKGSQASSHGLDQVDFEIEFEPVDETVSEVTLSLESIWVDEVINMEISLIKESPTDLIEVREIEQSEDQTRIILLTPNGIWPRGILLNGTIPVKDQRIVDQIKTPDGIFDLFSLTFEGSEIPESLFVTQLIHPKPVQVEFTLE